MYNPQISNEFVYSSLQQEPLSISFNTIDSIFNSININKAMGPDKIKPLLIKKMNLQNRKWFHVFFNVLLKLKIYPDSWKKAKIFPLHKRGTPSNDVNNFRPIAILSCLAKIYDKIIFHLVKSKTNLLELIPEFQHGFMENKSTITALNTTTSWIKEKLNRNIPTVAVSVDVAKAFDSIDRATLINLLHANNIDSNLIELIACFLSNRRGFVTWGGSCSEEFFMNKGTPQGSVLSPILFNFYLKDLSPPICTNNIECKITQFADDIIALFANSDLMLVENKVNHYVNYLSNFFHSIHLAVNPDKSKFIIFHNNLYTYSNKTRKLIKNLSVKINNTNIGKVDSINYLGILFDKKLSFSEDTTQRIKNCNARFFNCYNVFKNKNLSNKIKVNLYKTLVRPIATYGFIARCGMSSFLMEKYRLMERKFLRICLGVKRRKDNKGWPRNLKLYEKFNISRIDNYCIKLIKNINAKGGNYETVYVNNTENIRQNRRLLEPSFLSTESFDNQFWLSSNNPLYNIGKNGGIVYDHIVKE